MGLLQHVEYQISALNDLIRINTDRIISYKKTIEALDDEELIESFQDIIYQSEQHIAELKNHIYLLGGKLYNGNNLPGKFYHAWMDVKSTFIPRDKRVILDNCEHGEDVVKSSYRKALLDKELIYEDKKVINLLTNQYRNLKAAYNTVKSLRTSLLRVG